AERARDSTMIAAIAIELGLWYWRTYDGMAHRRRAPYELPLPHLIDESESRRDLDHLAEAYFPKSANNSGELDYLRASELFLIALRAEPGNGRAWMYSYTSLLALDAWDELEAAARTRLRAVHNDAWAWMTMGLALHRLIKEAEAAHAFDRALSIFSPTERRRLTRLSRLLRPEDSVRVANMSDADRTSTERAYWMIADPLMLTAENEHWLEFLSRVTHSELMFTNEEFHQRGADSPRGEVFIRYGPPHGIIATGPDIRGYYGHWWRYRDGLEFYFDLYGPTRMVDERSFAAQRRRYAARPSSFANVAITRSLLTVPVAITRFRGPSDSTDIVVAAEFPLRPLTSGIDLNAGELRLALTTFGGSADSASRDGESLALDLRSARAAQSLRRTWRHRFASTEMGLRVEALQVESERGARAVAAVEAIPHSGFTMSDVLVADSVRAGSARDPRWSDLEFSATPGELVAARQLGLVWETYDLGADSTRSSAYRVDIGLVRTDGSRIGRAVARVIGGTLGRGEGRGRDDRVTVSFERRVPSRPVTLDYLTLDLGDLASGRYRLTITVTDLVTSATTERERELTIVR
ncbi:MAG TPA: GWxTD domain-containing protein, partial [Gemmatimonadaceae bacterium]|nr:GWxTD domain-containing protein [Gemmatimonadaceae bacterium]